MKLLIHILHLIPFLHIYGKWVDVGNHGGYHKQKKYCKVCNKVVNRLESFGFDDNPSPCEVKDA